MYQFATEYLLSWFPDLGSYQAFNNSLNRMSYIMNQLVEHLIENFQPTDCSATESLLDSMPIIACSGKRCGKVAKEITDKGYSSSKGLTLHVYGRLTAAL